MRVIHLSVLLVLCAIIVGCSVKLPLCPEVSSKSYLDGTLSPINRYLADNCRQRQITVEILSPFVAEFTSSTWELAWLEGNYKYLICGFEPGKVDDVGATYTSCMKHADEWMAAIKSGFPEKLMLDQYYYKENCVRNQFGLGK